MVSNVTHVVLSFVLGYLLGSIPFGLLLTRWAGLGDIRAIGSGNIGATNVLRTGRKELAAATLILDALKGAAAVLIAANLSPMAGPLATPAAALGAVLGHLFPLWLSFKGGKGVATTLGVLWGLSWPVAAIACTAWLVIAALFRYSSVAALLSLVIGAIAAWFLTDRPTAILVTLLIPLVWQRHHENIRRLLAGTESKIGQRVGATTMGHNGGPTLGDQPPRQP